MVERKRKTPRKHRAPPGAAPGTLIAHSDALPSAVRVVAYDGAELVEREIEDLGEIEELLDQSAVCWINVDGLGDVGTIRLLGERFGIHPLAQEDVLNTHQRPKVEVYDGQVYIVIRMPGGGRDLATEQVSVFLGDDYVLTFQERPGDCFDPVRTRLRAGRKRIREGGGDYLAYALLDAIIDGYYPVLEVLGDRLETLEAEILENPSAALIAEVHGLKRDLLTLRRAIWPLREMLNTLIRDSLPNFADETLVFLRDCYDHTIQLLDMIETYREIAGGLVDLHFSSVGMRMNEIMKVLTIIATIFIPLGFIAGLYGMNFDPQVSPWNMPELGWYWGYPFVLGLMAAAAGGLLIYFRRRGWIGGGARSAAPPPPPPPPASPTDAKP